MTTLTLQVSASADDAIQLGSGSTSINGTQLRVGNNSGNGYIIGSRFQNVTIAKNTTITSAYFTLTAETSYTTTATIAAIVACQATDNGTTFTATSNNLGTANRARTTAKSSSWSLKSVTANTEYSIDVTSAVQEIINRSGWVSGNAINILVDNNASATSEWQDFYSFDNTAAKAPKLVIVYSSASGQTLNPSLLTNSSTFFAPTVTSRVTVSPPKLTNNSNLYVPAVIPGAVQLHPPVLVNQSAFLSPKLNLKLYGTLLHNTSVFYLPSIIVGSKTLTAPLLVNSSVLYPPTIINGSVTLHVPRLINTSVLHVPSVIPGGISLAVPKLVNTSTLHVPTITQGGVSLHVPLLVNTSVLYPPDVVPGTVTLLVPHLVNTSQIFVPKIAQVVKAPRIQNNSTLYAPHVTTTNTLYTPLLVNTTNLHVPTVTSTCRLLVPLLVNNSILFVPAVTPGKITLNVPRLVNISTLLPPQVSIVVKVPILVNTSVLYSPHVSSGAITLHVQLLTNESILYPFYVTGGVIYTAVWINKSTLTINDKNTAYIDLNTHDKDSIRIEDSNHANI